MITTEDKNFDRDPKTFALINNNVGEYQRRKAQKMNSQRVDKVEEEIKSLKDDISELKQLILRIGK